jgi:hypothetical protein
MSYSATVAAAPQSLIGALDFSLPSSAEYVKSRQQVTFQPSGGSTYGGATNPNIIRWHIADSEGFLDPASVKIMMTVNNESPTAAHILTPLSNLASCMFSRWTVKAGGQIIEDISSYNSVSQAMALTRNKHILDDMEYEGFNGIAAPLAGNAVGAAGSVRVGFSPLSGILQQGKYLPIRYLSGLTIELTVADGTEWLNSTAGATSALFSLTRPELKCDLAYIAGDLAEQYASYLLNSAPLPIVYSNYYVTTQAIVATATEFTINLARSCSKLQSIFFILGNSAANDTLKKVNRLQSPGGEDFSFKVQVGSKRFPLQDVVGFSESRAKLSQAVGVHASSSHSLAMTQTEYRANSWIGAVDTELCAVGAHFTGTDTRAGDLLTVQLKGMTAGPTSVTVILLAQTILNVRDSGVDLLD